MANQQTATTTMMKMTTTMKERQPNQAYFISKHSINQEIESGMVMLKPIFNIY